jgi:hypothetical protein
MILESSPDVVARIQQESLDVGAFLWHLRYSVVVSQATDGTMGVHYRARTASRDLLALLCARNEDSMGVLSRCFPIGIIRGLFSVDAPSEGATSIRSSSIPSSLSTHDATALAGMALHEVDVCLGARGELWWNPCCCAKFSSQSQRLIAEKRVKVCIFATTMVSLLKLKRLLLKLMRSRYVLLAARVVWHRNHLGQSAQSACTRRLTNALELARILEFDSVLICVTQPCLEHGHIGRNKHVFG